MASIESGPSKSSRKSKAGGSRTPDLDHSDVRKLRDVVDGAGRLERENYTLHSTIDDEGEGDTQEDDLGAEGTRGGEEEERQAGGKARDESKKSPGAAPGKDDPNARKRVTCSGCAEARRMIELVRWYRMKMNDKEEKRKRRSLDSGTLGDVGSARGRGGPGAADDNRGTDVLWELRRLNDTLCDVKRIVTENQGY